MRALLLMFVLAAHLAAQCTFTGKTIVFIGSSTTVGSGATDIPHSYVGLYTASLAPGNTVINLAVGGYDTYRILPTGHNNGDKSTVDTAHNITAALTYNPVAIIVNMPTNDTVLGYFEVESQNNFNLVVATARAVSVPIWITSTQPRNLGTAGQNALIDLGSWIMSAFAPRAIDFWTGLANPDGSINPIYNSGDGIHLNNAGHAILASRVEAAGIGCGMPLFPLPSPVGGR